MFSLLSIVLMVLVDQLVKLWAVKTLAPDGFIDIIPNFFGLSYVENRGAAFSFLQDKRWFFLIVTVIVLLIIAYVLKKSIIYTNLGRISLILVAGGASGNFIDRLFRGFVVDMFNLYKINFPVFNIADIFITVGGILFAYYILIQHDRAGEHHG